jgi:hypothetical protein
MRAGGRKDSVRHSICGRAKSAILERLEAPDVLRSQVHCRLFILFIVVYYYCARARARARKRANEGASESVALSRCRLNVVSLALSRAARTLQISLGTLRSLLNLEISKFRNWR